MRVFEEAEGFEGIESIFFRKGDRSKGKRGLPLERRERFFFEDLGKSLRKGRGKRKKKSRWRALFFYEELGNWERKTG